MELTFNAIEPSLLCVNCTLLELIDDDLGIRDFGRLLLCTDEDTLCFKMNKITNRDVAGITWKQSKLFFVARAYGRWSQVRLSLYQNGEDG